MAIACRRLFTLPPRPPLPLRKVPRLRRRIALSTVLLAALPYFRRLDLRVERFFAAMEPPRIRGDPKVSPPSLDRLLAIRRVQAARAGLLQAQHRQLQPP